MKILLIFTLCLISDGGVSEEVTGYSGAGVLIKCKYDSGYTENQKYFCKGSPPGCEDQIKTGYKNVWINSGRFSLYDDTRSSEFSVMIRELTVQDTGTYHCGVDIDYWKDDYTPVTLTVKKGDLVSREVITHPGGGINIKCRYEDKYKDKPKSFCKIQTTGTPQWCFNGIQTKLNSDWSHDGRFSINDNRSAGFFSVFIRELITEDTGTYACAVVVSDELKNFTVVNLNVKEDPSYKMSISKTVHVGEDLSVSCKYPESLRSNNMFLCKMLQSQTAACSYKSSVKENRKDVKERNFFLYDDRETKILTVSIRNVTLQDSGEYWCGAEVHWTSDHGYKVYFTQIILTVTDIHIPHSEFISITVIVVPVSLLVLLIAIIFLSVTLHKRCKTQGPETITYTSRETNGDENDANLLHFQSRQMSNEYKSVYRSVSPNTNQSKSVYQSPNPKTNQSKSVYQSPNPNTNQSKSVYQSPNRNTNQSDSVYQSVNPNTNQSDSVYKSPNRNTNQSDSVYQSPNRNINQSDSVYQCLNLKTNQSDSVYQSLNLNTNQSDSVYQSLNLNTNQSDSVYQSPKPNTN